MARIGVGDKYHISLNGIGYLFRGLTYHKKDARVLVSRFGTSEQGENDLDLFKSWSQENFSGGSFQDNFVDEDRVNLLKNLTINKYDNLLYPTRKSVDATMIASWLTSSPGYAVYKGELYVVANGISGTPGGLAKYNPATKTFTSVKTDFGSAVYDLCVFDGCLYVISVGNGIFRWNGTTWTVKTGDSFFSMAAFNGSLYGTSNSAVNTYLSKRGTDITLAGSLVGAVGGGAYPAKLKEFNHRLYIGKADGLYAYDGVQISCILDYSTDIDPTNFAFMETFNGVLYFTSKNTLFKFNGSTIEAVRYFENYETINYLGSGNGRLWLTTMVKNPPLGSGLNTGDYAVYAYDGNGFVCYNGSRSGVGSPYLVAPISTGVYEQIVCMIGGVVGGTGTVTNLCTNPAFTAGTANPDWLSYNASYEPANWAVSLVQQALVDGVRAAVMYGSTNGYASNTTANVTPSSLYICSVDLKASAAPGATQGFRLTMLHNGTTIATTDVWPTSDGSFHRFELSGTTTAATAGIVFKIEVIYTGNSSGYQQAFRKVLIEAGSSASTYFDGDITDTTQVIYSWTGTAKLSTSTKVINTVNTAFVIDMTNEYSGETEVASLYSSYFDAGFPNIEKVIESVSIGTEGLSSTDSIDVYLRYFEGNAWTGFQKLGSITATSLTNRLRIPDTSLSSTFKKLQLRIDFTRSALSTAAIRNFSVKYYLSPDYKREWSMTLLCQGDSTNPLELINGDLETRTAIALRDNVYLARESYIPVSFEDMDFTILNGAINDSVTTVTSDSSYGYASKGYLKIDDEVISYTGRTSTQFTGCVRGCLGTVAAAHLDNAYISPYFRVVVSDIMNEAVIEPSSDSYGTPSEITVVLKEV